MPKFQQIKACVTDCLKVGRSSMVHGEPGIGKTQMNYQVASDLPIFGDTNGATGVPVYLFSAELHQPVDLHGVPVPDLDKGVTRWMQPGTLPFIGSELPPGLIFIDEINRAEKDMQSALYPLVLEHRIGEHILKPGCYISAAGNRKIDKSGVNPLQRALADRLTHYHLEADLEEWIAGHALNQSGNGWPILIAFLRMKERRPEKKDRLFCNNENVTADTLASPNPRSWSVVAKMIDFRDETRFLSIAGTVGETAASELESFLRFRKDIPSMNDILLDALNAKIPVEGAATFAVAGMIAHHADNRNFAKLLTYAERLGAEYQAMFAQDVTNRDPSIRENAAYVQWAIANQQLTL